MATLRLMPPADGLHPQITVNGRTYVCQLGATLDVPDFDALVMEHNGWTRVADAVGSTAQRPVTPLRAQTFHDTTLGKTIRYDGKAWRDPASGAAV
jgi:hypothetical protein